MALTWKKSSVGILKVHDASSNDMFSLNNIIDVVTSGWAVEDAATAANFLFAIGGKSCVADENTSYEHTYGVIDNG